MRGRMHVAALLLAVLGDRAFAHHAIGGVYDSSRQQTIEGVVAEFRFTNPHPFLFVEVETDSALRQIWRLEMDNRFELARIGMTAETFQPGERVIARGSVGRVRPQSLYLRRLDRPADGLRYEQRGGTPYLMNRRRPARRGSSQTASCRRVTGACSLSRQHLRVLCVTDDRLAVGRREPTLRFELVGAHAHALNIILVRFVKLLERLPIERLLIALEHALKATGLRAVTVVDRPTAAVAHRPSE
jgi:hypothetical protein